MSAFITIAVLHFLAVVSPGPDFAITVKNSVCYSRRTSIVTALGIACGIWVHVVYCILGLAFVISQSIVLFSIVKYIGAFYLVYVGIQSLRAKKSEAISDYQDIVAADLPIGQAFWQGFLCNVLNPKATLFFLSLFTLVVDVTTPVWIQFVYGLEMFLVTFLWFAFLGILLTHKIVKAKISNVQHIVSRIMGGVLVLLGFKLAVSTAK